MMLVVLVYGTFLKWYGFRAPMSAFGQELLIGIWHDDESLDLRLSKYGPWTNSSTIAQKLV